MITCYFEGNNKAKGGLRHVTMNAIIVHNGAVLLGMRGVVKGKKMAEFGKWGLIGGYFDRDETLTQGLRREALEESGCEIDNIILFRINDNPQRPMEDKQNVDFIFIADLVKQTPRQDEEVTQLKWFPLDDLPLREDIAFDHGDSIYMYREYLKKNHPLPLFG
jgi:8-oxo-dGTP diphosphatase